MASKGSQLPLRHADMPLKLRTSEGITTNNDASRRKRKRTPEWQTPSSSQVPSKRPSSPNLSFSGLYPHFLSSESTSPFQIKIETADYTQRIVQHQASLQHLTRNLREYEYQKDDRFFATRKQLELLRNRIEELKETKEGKEAELRSWEEGGSGSAGKTRLEDSQQYV